MTYEDLLNDLQKLSPEELKIPLKIFVPACDSELGESFDDAFYNLGFFKKYDEGTAMSWPYFHILD
jgi:hypothetical protein